MTCAARGWSLTLQTPGGVVAPQGLAHLEAKDACSPTLAGWLWSPGGAVGAPKASGAKQ